MQNYFIHWFQKKDNKFSIENKVIVDLVQLGLEFTEKLEKLCNSPEAVIGPVQRVFLNDLMDKLQENISYSVGYLQCSENTGISLMDAMRLVKK